MLKKLVDDMLEESFNEALGLKTSKLEELKEARAREREEKKKALIKNGKVVQQFKSKKIHRVISEKASLQMVEILKSVVKAGTGGKAALDGFDVAGKTGTAQKYNMETQSYSGTEYISSFIGFAPADSPRLVILVMIDNPKGLHWGSVVAAPVFRKITKRALRYLNIPSSKERVFILDRA